MAMLLPCSALPPYPRWTYSPALVNVANAANVLQLPMPPKLGRLVSPVLWVVYQAVNNLRQPWDLRHCVRVGTTHSVAVVGNTSRRHGD